MNEMIVRDYHYNVYYIKNILNRFYILNCYINNIIFGSSDDSGNLYNQIILSLLINLQDLADRIPKLSFWESQTTCSEDSAGPQTRAGNC